MEVEKVEDGPLKNSEITRFLEASNTTYRAIDSILSEKKETSFQQRTLLDIASESEKKNKKETKETGDQLEEPTPKSKEEEEEELKKEAEAQKLREEQAAETLRIEEEQKLNEERMLQEKKEKEIFEDGFANGKASIETELKEKLGNGLLLLENARKSMLDLNASHFIKLREDISSQILRLASVRAGIEISELPNFFFKKIETLIENIGQITQAPTVYVNSKDLEAIKDLVPESLASSGFTFKSKEGLLSGDVSIEMGSLLAIETTIEHRGVNFETEVAELQKAEAERSPPEEEISEPEVNTSSPKEEAEPEAKTSPPEEEISEPEAKTPSSEEESEPEAKTSPPKEEISTSQQQSNADLENASRPEDKKSKKEADT